MDSGDCSLAFIYHPIFDGRGFSRLSNSWRRYALEHVARCWTVILATLSNAWTDDDRRFGELFAADAAHDGPAL